MYVFRRPFDYAVQAATRRRPIPSAATATDVTVSPSLLTATLTLFAPTIAITQIAHPTSDVSAGGWTTDTGATTDLYAAIDEATPADDDFIRSPESPTADVCEIALGTLTDPGTDAGFVVRYRYGKSAAGGEQIDLTVSLVEGTTVIASWLHTDVSDTLTTVGQTLSEAEAAEIVDFGDLRLRFEATAA